MDIVNIIIIEFIIIILLCVFNIYLTNKITILNNIVKYKDNYNNLYYEYIRNKNKLDLYESSYVHDDINIKYKI